MLDWDGVPTKTLKAIYEATEEALNANPSLPFEGVTSAEVNKRLKQTEDDPRVCRVLEHLADAGYLKVTFPTESTAYAIRLKEKGLQEVAGWPSVAGPHLAVHPE